MIPAIWRRALPWVAKHEQTLVRTGVGSLVACGGFLTLAWWSRATAACWMLLAFLSVIVCFFVLGAAALRITFRVGEADSESWTIALREWYGSLFLDFWYVVACIIAAVLIVQLVPLLLGGCVDA